MKCIFLSYLFFVYLFDTSTSYAIIIQATIKRVLGENKTRVINEPMTLESTQLFRSTRHPDLTFNPNSSKLRNFATNEKRVGVV